MEQQKARGAGICCDAELARNGLIFCCFFNDGDRKMKKLIVATGLVIAITGAVLAQSNTVQGSSNNPHPPRSASSNDASKNPSAYMRQTQAQGQHHGRRHHRKHHVH
ncbi:hypothetical protein [Afipia felis]|uniref:hypothetical protein n=1 Tax=Afipia felis TaxID=1035 RepID=UPI001AEBE224|nr:hypothetical protein [Afipia felis]